MKIYYTLFLLFITIGLKAQIACDWAYVPAGPSQTYHTIYISTTDLSGNIIQLGKNLGNADMDPSPLPGDTSFCYAGFNYYVSSTADSGKLNWIRYFEDNSQIGQFEFKGLQVNSQNEIIILGNYFGLIDFDLSSTGVDTLRSHAPTYPDYFVAKYDSLGNYVFAISIGPFGPNTSTSTSAGAGSELTNTTRVIWPISAPPLMNHQEVPGSTQADDESPRPVFVSSRPTCAPTNPGASPPSPAITSGREVSPTMSTVAVAPGDFSSAMGALRLAMEEIVAAPGRSCPGRPATFAAATRTEPSLDAPGSGQTSSVVATGSVIPEGG
jgi:hypothetical protein